jgi:predicted transposase YbfD/YdcC
MPEPSSLSFFAHFTALNDPRIERTKRHPLLEIVFVAVCALLSGANDFVGMEKFGKAKRDWLMKYVELPNGVPSHDTFGRVMQAVSPQEFVDCFRSWVSQFHEQKKGGQICIDGKTARASLDRAAEQNPLHVVSAWATDQGLLLGQVAVDDKSNEITAIPKLLEMLELKGALVTIDAMGCQREIAATIHAKGGDYLLAVKGNQEHLEEDVIAEFAAVDARRDLRQEGDLPTVYESADANHGRTEKRRCEALPAPKTIRNREGWAGLQSICRVTRTYIEKGVDKSEVRYFISTLPAKAKELGLGVRGHWGIENGLHWVLDMVFAEDRSRARLGHAQENLALLRRWAMSVQLQNKAVKGSMEKKRLQTGWNNNNLEKLLDLF